MEVPGDAAIVATVLRGDKDAFAQLVRRHQAVVLATALPIVRDTHAAQDIAQMAFVTAYRKLATLHRAAAFGPWVLTITRRLALRAAHNGKRNPRSDDRELLAHTPAPPATPAPPDESLMHAIAALPEHERVVVALHYFQRMSLAEVGRVLGRPIGTVTKQLARAHARLRRELGNPYEE